MFDSIPIRIHFNSESVSPDQQPTGYRMVDRLVLSNRPLSNLSIWETAHQFTDTGPGTDIAVPQWATDNAVRVSTTVFDRSISPGFASRGDLDCVVMDADNWILIDHQNQTITAELPDCPPQLAEHLVLGPALVLLFARCERWLIHGSAVALDGNVIGFCGASGAGKSTLARRLSSQFQSITRVADDILTLSSDPGGATDYPVTCHSTMHQPALTPDQQPDNLAARLPVRLLCVLEGKDQPRATMTNLAPGEGCVRVLNHLMASHLPLPWLQDNQLEFASRLTERASVYSLTYPHRRGSIDQVYTILQQRLDTGS